MLIHFKPGQGAFYSTFLDVEHHNIFLSYFLLIERSINKKYDL